MAQNWYLTSDMYFNGDETSILLSEARDVFDEMVQYGNESFNIEIDGVATRGIVQDFLSRVYNNKIPSNEKKLLTRLTDVVHVGSIITWNNDYWIILDTPDKSNQVYYTSRMRKCNLNPFRFKINNITKEVKGYYEKNIFINSDNQPINLPDDTVFVIVPKNSDTSKIKKNDEFYLYGDDWYEKYKVVGLDKGKKDGNYGLIIIKAKEVQSEETPEQFYNLSPISPIIGNVVVTPSSVSITLGDIKQLIAKVYDLQGNEMTGESVIWSSTNTFVATVDQNGLVTSQSVGNCEIWATSNTDSTIIGKCVVEVVSGGGWW